MPLADIVNVVVTINQSTVAQQGFGVPLIFANVPWPDLVRTYRANDWATSLAADLGGTAAGATQHAAYQCAAAMMRQSPRPTTFKIGRRSVAETQVVRITVTGTGPHSLTVTSPVGVSTAITQADAASLATALTAVDGIAAANEAGIITVTTDLPNRVFSYGAMTAGLTLADASVNAAGTVATDLAAISDVDDDWYGLVLASPAPTLIRPAADWIETVRKIMVASTHDASTLAAVNVGDPDPVAYVDSLNYARTHVAYHSRAGQFYGAAWMANVMVYEPGAVDWKFKTLRGVIADKISGTQAGHLLGKGGSYYENPIRGLDITGAAMGGDGVFLDLTQLSDWTVARIQEGIISMLAAAPKTAFTDEDGGNKIWGVLRSVVMQGVQLGAIDGNPETYSVYVPRRAELSSAARSGRRWEGCSLSYRPTGAVHSVGTINVLLNVA